MVAYLFNHPHWDYAHC